jgi:hypothetical protein
MSRSLEGDDNIEAFMDEAIDIQPKNSTNKLDKRPVPKGTPSPSAKVNTLLHDLFGIMLLPLGFKLFRNMCWNLEDGTFLVLSSIRMVYNYVSPWCVQLCILLQFFFFHFNKLCKVH